MKPANYAPVYCALYPELAEIAREHGYALAIHGTLGRDGDFICIPWVDQPSHPQQVVDAICSRFSIRQINGIEEKKHGRVAYTLSIGHGDCALDLSFMPTIMPLVKLTEQQRLSEILKQSVLMPGKPFSIPSDIRKWIEAQVTAGVDVGNIQLHPGYRGVYVINGGADHELP